MVRGALRSAATGGGAVGRRNVVVAAPAAASVAAPSGRLTRSQAQAALRVATFSGQTLDRSWTRRFVLGTVLQRFDPLRQTEDGDGGGRERDLDAALLRHQRRLSERWSLPVKPLDATSTARILVLLSRFATGQGSLSLECLEALRQGLSGLPHADLRPGDEPAGVLRLLEQIGYVAPGDNLRRVSFGGPLRYPPSVEAMLEQHLREDLRRDGGDPYDGLRTVTVEPIYAIDSATTSEVDDAIGVHRDRDSGELFFTVYVSDATVYCPFDSPLEQLTARLLATTTYLPEGVFFMLPTPVVEAATLRSDRPCRTFEVTFQIDMATGELVNYAVGVGWASQLRRLTYDAVQALYDATAELGEEVIHRVCGPRAGPAAGDPGPDGRRAHVEEALRAQLPAWVTPRDAENLRHIHAAAKVRLAARTARAAGRLVEANLPDPLITVEGTRVVAVEDQIMSTKDARLAVAELMIAANEVCSRVAQTHHIPIPYRGTRQPSSDHHVAAYYEEPQGVRGVPSLDPHYLYFAQAMQQSVRRLSAVTRAFYSHQPLHHAGLDTHYYTHSTSPLRRYPDMLVHHQLKAWLVKQSRTAGAALAPEDGRRGLRSASMVAAPQSHRHRPCTDILEEQIPEFQMASLCAMASRKQEQSSLLQDASSRFWVLTHIQTNLLAHDPARRFVCLVGATRSTSAAPEYGRFLSSGWGPHGRAAPHALTSNRWLQRVVDYEYVSEVYLPEVQLAHVVFHSRPDVLVGAIVECIVTDLHPTLHRLVLEVVSVKLGDERRYEDIWRRGVVPTTDS